MSGGGEPKGGPDALTTLTGLFIRRPVLTIVLNLLLVVAGLAAFQAVEVRELPNVDQPVVSVTVALEGASPEAVDQQITSTIESAVARVSGIDSVSSRSSFGSSRVTIEFTKSTDLNVAASDVRDAVGRVVFQLPDDAEEPRVVKADADADAIMRLAVIAPRMPSDQLTTLVQDVIVDRLSAVEGVADVQENGDREERIFIDVDPDRLATRGLTLADLSSALRNVALDVPAGSLASPTQDLVVRANANVTTPEEFGAIVLNDRTRLRDVATVRFGPEDATSIVRINGQNGYGLGIVRQAGSSTLSISDGVRAAAAELNRTLPEGVSISVTSDDAIFIDGAIHEVELTLGFAVIIVIAVIYAFLLNLRATLIPAVTMPVSLIAVLAAVYLAGFSVNILTLLALVLATGLVVDDAIIVLENIVRRRDMGAKPQAAAVIGTREVFFAVIATTATLAAVFVPISFLPGQAGSLFTEFGFVLAIAVLLSSFVALTLCPMLASRLLQEKPSEAVRHGFLARGWIWFGGRLAALYASALRFSLAFPLVVLGLASMFAFSAFVAYGKLAQELTPPEDRGTIFLRVTTPQSAALDYTSSKVRQVEDVLLPYVRSGEAANVYSISGQGGSNNSAFVFLSLADWAERERPQSAIAAEINRAVAEIPGVRAFAIQPNSLGIRGGGRGLQFALLGSSYAGLADAAESLREAMEQDGRWGRVDLNFEATQPQLSVRIDRERASDLGIDIEGLATAVQAMLDGTQVTTTFIEDQAVPIEIVSTGQPVNDPSDLSNLFLKTGDGRIVPMSSVATLTEEPIARLALGRAEARLHDRPGLGRPPGLRRRAPAPRDAADPARRGQDPRRDLRRAGPDLRLRHRDRAPGAGGAVRELRLCPHHHRHRALRPRLRGVRPPVLRAEPQPLQPDRPRPSRRHHRQERHPRRGVRQCRARPRPVGPRGRRGGGDDAPAPGDDDDDRDGGRRRAADLLDRRGRRGAPGARLRHRRRPRPRDAGDALHHAHRLPLPRPLLQAPGGGPRPPRPRVGGGRPPRRGRGRPRARGGHRPAAGGVRPAGAPAQKPRNRTSSAAVISSRRSASEPPRSFRADRDTADSSCVASTKSCWPIRKTGLRRRNGAGTPDFGRSGTTTRLLKRSSSSAWTSRSQPSPTGARQ
jgi:hydrophobic/amphiphilic exporter-1 (mainly G- bacteria), HAE1 family